MPRTGAPSRACLACRGRHLKCDEARPACMACVRASLACVYKDESDIFMRDQTATIREKFKQPDRRPSKSGRGRKPDSPRNCEDSSSPKSLEPPSSLRPALTQDPESTAVAIWLTRYCPQKRDPQGDQGLTALIPSFYSQAPVDSAFSLAVSAEALAIVGRWPERIDWKRLSLSKYTEAVALVNKALESPSERRKDDILMTVFVLFFYERVNLPFTPGVALAHLNGAVSLIKARGAASFSMPDSQMLLWLARSHAISIYMSPLEDMVLDDDLWIDPPAGMYQTAATRLITIISTMSTVRRLMRTSAELDPTNDVLILNIISTAQDIDNKLVQWSESVPIDWKPRAAATVSKYIREAGMYGELCLVYSNLWAANAWNRYRTVRIALQTIILQYVNRLLIPTEDAGSTVRQAQTALRLECDGLCACVPFYLGSRNTHATVDQPLVEFPQCDEFRMSEQTREQLMMFGEWYLFWPVSRMVQNLQILAESGHSCIPDDQFRWAQEQVVRCGRRARTRSPLTEEA